VQRPAPKANPLPRVLRAAARLALLALGALLTVFLVLAVVWPPLAEVDTGMTPEYPSIQPQVLRYSPELVLERAAQTVQLLDGWHLVSADRATGVVRAEHRSPLFHFVDDIIIRVEPFGAGSRVDVRSRCRDLSADFGQNARNIRSFQAALAERLELARQVR
jgi:uncharacterized protein (DUF1499 family)